MGNNPNRNVADREPSDSLVCRIELRHCEGKLKHVVRKPFTCSDDFFLSKKTSLQKRIRSSSTPMIPVDTFITSKLHPPPSRILLSNPKWHWFEDQTLLLPLSVSNPNYNKLPQMPVLVPVDLTFSRSFRKPICWGTLMEGTSLLRPEFVKSFLSDVVWWVGAQTSSKCSPNFFSEKQQLPRICNDTR